MNEKFLRIMFAFFISFGVWTAQCEAKTINKTFQKWKKALQKKSSTNEDKTGKAGKIHKTNVLSIVVDTFKNQFVIINNSFSKNLEAEDPLRINQNSLLKSKKSTVTSHDLQNFIKKLKNRFIGDSINCLTALITQVENITKTKLQGVDEILALKGVQIDNDSVQKLLYNDDQKKYNKEKSKYSAISRFENMEVLFKKPKNSKAEQILNDPVVESLKIKRPIKQKEMNLQTKMKNMIYKYLKQDISDMMRLAKKVEKEAKTLTKFKNLSIQKKAQVIKEISEPVEEIAKILVKYTVQFNNNSKYQYDFDVTDSELNTLIEDSDKRQKYLAEKYGNVGRNEDLKMETTENKISNKKPENIVKKEIKKNSVKSESDKNLTLIPPQNKTISLNTSPRNVQFKEEKSELEKKLEERKKMLKVVENQRVFDFSMTEDEIKSEMKDR